MTALLSAELRKALTLRYWWALALAPLALAALLPSSIHAVTTDGVGPLASDRDTAAMSVGLVVAIGAAALFAGIFGAVTTGTEFRYRTLAPTFLTARGRDGVLTAKVAVVALFGVGCAVAVEVVALAGLIAVGSADLTTTPGLVGMLTSGIAATVAWSLIGAGLGLLVTSPVAAVVALVIWYPIGELLMTAALTALGAESVVRWFPGAATLSTVTAPTGAVDGLLPWPVAAVTLCAWTAATAGLGWRLTRRRDVI